MLKAPKEDIVSAEFEGKTIAQAIENACRATGLASDQLTYEVLCQGASGLFGLVGVRKARIRVFLPEAAPAPAGPETCAMPVTPRPKPGLAPDRFQPQQAPSLQAEAALKLGTQALQRMADAITEGTTVDGQTQNGQIQFNLNGGNLGLLIGKHGQTLEALHYLADKIINRGNVDRLRIHVDVEGYLEKRGQGLKEKAIRLAANARRNGRPLTLEPMSAYERRIIHMALKNDASVRTQSVGDGLSRQLIIYPLGISGHAKKHTGPTPGAPDKGKPRTRRHRPAKDRTV